MIPEMKIPGHIWCLGMVLKILKTRLCGDIIYTNMAADFGNIT